MKDTIGVLLEFKQGKGEITYYRNGQNLGVAFTNIPPGTYYPGVNLYYGEIQVTLNPKPKAPADFHKK